MFDFLCILINFLKICIIINTQNNIEYVHKVLAKIIENVSLISCFFKCRKKISMMEETMEWKKP